MIKQNHTRWKCPSMVFLVLKLALVGRSAESYRNVHLTRWRNDQTLFYATYPAVILVAISMGRQRLDLARSHSHPTQRAPRVHLKTPFAALARSYVLQTCRTNSFACIRYFRVSITLSCNTSPFALMISVQNELVGLRRR